MAMMTMSGESTNMYDDRVSCAVIDRVDVADKKADRANTAVKNLKSDVDTVTALLDSKCEAYHGDTKHAHHRIDNVEKSMFNIRHISASQFAIISAVLSSKLFRFLNWFGRWYVIDKDTGEIFLQAKKPKQL